MPNIGWWIVYPCFKFAFAWHKLCSSWIIPFNKPVRVDTVWLMANPSKMPPVFNTRNASFKTVILSSLNCKWYKGPCNITISAKLSGKLRTLASPNNALNGLLSFCRPFLRLLYVLAYRIDKVNAMAHSGEPLCIYTRPPPHQ